MAGRAMFQSYLSLTLLGIAANHMPLPIMGSVSLTPNTVQVIVQLPLPTCVSVQTVGLEGSDAQVITLSSLLGQIILLAKSVSVFGKTLTLIVSVLPSRFH